MRNSSTSADEVLRTLDEEELALVVGGGDWYHGKYHHKHYGRKHFFKKFRKHHYFKKYRHHYGHHHC